MNPNMYPQAPQQQWQQPPQRPAGPGVDIKVSYAWRAGCMSAIGGTILLFTIAVVVWSLLSQDATTADAAAGSGFKPGALVFPIFGLLWFVPLIIFAGEKARIPMRIDPTGVIMRNGTVLPWNEYRGVRPHVRRASSDTTGREWALELLFARAGFL